MKEGNRRKSGMKSIIFSSPLLGESGTKCRRMYLLWQLILPPLGYRPFPPYQGANLVLILLSKRPQRSSDSAESLKGGNCFLLPPLQGEVAVGGRGLIIFSSHLLGGSGTKCRRMYLLWQLILPPLGYRPFPPYQGAISFSLPPLGYRPFPLYRGQSVFHYPLWAIAHFPL